MRSKEEIQQKLKEKVTETSDPLIHVSLSLVFLLEVLLDIRELLNDKIDRTGEVDMDKYNNHTPCIKCGVCVPANVEYVPATLGYKDGKGYECDEHIKRTCIKCGYWWREKCLDTKEGINDKT